jgi:Ca2+-binding EF-hand superfamily protein
MLREGSIIALRSALPFMRASNLRLKDLLTTLNADRSGFVNTELIGSTFRDYGLSDDEAEDAMVCFDGRALGQVPYESVLGALKNAAKVLAQREKKERKREAAIEARNAARKAANETLKATESAFTKSDLVEVFKFLDYTNDGSVNIEETLKAFSKAKRAKVEEKMLRKGKLLLKKLFEVVKSHGLSIIDWFNSMDTTFQRDQMLEETDSESEDDDGDSGGVMGMMMGNPQNDVSSPSGSPSVSPTNGRRPPRWLKKTKGKGGPPPRPTGTLSTYELRAGFKKMASSRRDGMKMGETDLVNLLRYVDPNGDGDLSFDELETAVARIYQTSKEEERRNYVFSVLRRIDEVAKSNGSMLMTVFYDLDKDGSGEVSREEFVAGVIGLKRPEDRRGGGYHEPTYASQSDLQDAIDDADVMKRELQHGELVRLERNGAGRVLRTMVSWMKERGLTVTMLIRELDRNGDGEVDHRELIEGVKKFMEPSTRVKAAKREKVSTEGMV